MKCCKKFVAIAVLVALGIGTVSVLRHGWGSVIRDHVAGAFKSHIPPEVQIERVKAQIGKLDQDIEKNWTPIATREYDIKTLQKELEAKKNRLTTTKAELQIAAKALEDNVVKVIYNGKDRTPSEARKMIRRDLVAFESLSREVDSKGKLLTAWQKELDAMMAQQDEMKKMKSELETRVAHIEADLKVLRLAETKSKLPVGDASRLNDIKATLAELEKNNEIMLREHELRNKYDRGENVSGTAKDFDSNEELINNIKKVTGSDKDAEDVAGK
jgi:hypothetical protein